MANFGYINPAAGHQDPSPGGMRMGGGQARTAAPQLTNTVPIGIPATNSGQQQQQQQQDSRGSSFMKGIGEARPGANVPEAAGGVDAAAGGGADAAGAVTDLAPLALAAL
jgi:hypothetical protein